MSAIVGIYWRDGRPVEPAHVERMTLSLAHRGPDAAGVWTNGSVGLGHRMLWTTPESLHEPLPFISKNGHLVITADARIDNRAELIASLGLAQWSHGEITDSELILRAYEQWREDAPKRLRGDFAFAIWDERERTLFCARDHSGVKPFYYYRSAESFVFASEIKALLTMRGVPRRLNPMRVADYLTHNFEDRVGTFYRDILRLPAGHRLTVRGAELRLEAYDGLDPSREIRLRSDAEYAEAFCELFAEAVRCRLRSAFPVGSLLSGGLDSSSIVGMAHHLLREEGRTLHTFSAIFPSLPSADLRRIDERPFVQAVVAMTGPAAHYVHADRVSPMSDLDRVFSHGDEPFLAPNLYMHWALYRAAQQQGVRALLDGVDGDTTVCHGLDYLSELARAGRVAALGREVMALAQRHGASPSKVLWQFGLAPLVPAQLRRAWRAAHGRSDVPGRNDTVIHPAFARHLGLPGGTRSLGGRRTKPARTTREGHWQGLTSPLLPYVLEIGDKAAAAFSLEPRYPFFDRRLMEFCLALPPEQKLHHGWTRVVMRRAMNPMLPAEVCWRVGKADLSPNFKHRLWDHDRGILEDVIVKDPQVLAEYVDIAALREAYRRYASQPMAESDALTIHSAVTLALWLRRTGLAA
jgi:asparagine synthase (glutamine-hydrolysing)